MEYFSVVGPRYDIDRFGAALPRFSPRQADLLFVVGTITQRLALAMPAAPPRSPAALGSGERGPRPSPETRECRAVH
jgi:Ni,Fe-hydrogenase III small subunit